MPPKRQRETASMRAGLILPVQRFHRKMKKISGVKRLSVKSTVFVAAVVEYVAKTVLESSRPTDVKRITEVHINKAVKADPALKKLLGTILY